MFPVRDISSAKSLDTYYMVKQTSSNCPKTSLNNGSLQKLQLPMDDLQRNRAEKQMRKKADETFLHLKNRKKARE